MMDDQRKTITLSARPLHPLVRAFCALSVGMAEAMAELSAADRMDIAGIAEGIFLDAEARDFGRKMPPPVGAITFTRKAEAFKTYVVNLEADIGGMSLNDRLLIASVAADLAKLSREIPPAEAGPGKEVVSGK